jgi:hypothetical protein
VDCEADRAQKNDGPAGESVVDYRHKGVTRLNIAPAGLAVDGQIVRGYAR